MRSTERHPSPNRQGLIIVTTLAIAYVASHFFRASNVTIGLDLMRDLSIGPEALGALTGAFFFGFAATQIPCGFLFDRFGPRRSLVGMLILATSGGIIFTLAPTWPILLTGRVLMGAGFGVMLIGSMVVISRWFPPDRFSTLAAIAIWLVVRDAPPGHPFLARTGESPGQMLQGLMEVLRDRRLWPILALNFSNYACTFTVQGLWGGPFLREVHGLSAVAAGNVQLVAVIAYQIGMLAFGPLDRILDTRKWIAMGGTQVIIAILATLALWPHPPIWVPIGAIVGIGFLSATSTMVMTHGRGIIPDRLIGRGIATINTSVMFGVACMQTLSGISVGAFEPLADGARSETAYRALFAVLTVVLIIAVAIYSRSQDVKPSDEMRGHRQKQDA